MPMDVSCRMLASVALWRSARALYASLRAALTLRFKVDTLALSWSSRLLPDVVPLHPVLSAPSAAGAAAEGASAAAAASEVPVTTLKAPSRSAGVGGGAAGTPGEEMVTTSPLDGEGEPPNQEGLHTPRDVSCALAECAGDGPAKSQRSGSVTRASAPASDGLPAVGELRRGRGPQLGLPSSYREHREGQGQ